MHADADSDERRWQGTHPLRHVQVLLPFVGGLADGSTPPADESLSFLNAVGVTGCAMVVRGSYLGCQHCTILEVEGIEGMRWRFLLLQPSAEEVCMRYAPH